MPLTIRVSTDDASGSTVRVSLTGGLDRVTARTLERELAPILDRPTAMVLVLDLVAKAFDVIRALPDLTVFQSVDERDGDLTAEQRSVRGSA